jgi:uncharacterized cupin superfamily protein
LPAAVPLEPVERIAIDDAGNWIGPATEKRPLGHALGTEHLALNYYVLEPGETFGFGYHKHDDQEEVFYVLEGTATFETAEGDVAVEAGEAIRFAPGEFQLGRNDGEAPVRALALGAPPDSEDLEMHRECADCGGRRPNRIEPREDGTALVTICVECEAETGRFR